ncbi:pyridoxamine 5'-phosphate oxidase family protein [Streptomyces sp. NPDC006879]|uniref:pyridoxamine 5'-phosphate oxidase family protein n=1 Tax=Streptomyces sp. NPDC006879 TaxID=3364767 RepID=UPI0036B88648
MDGRAEWSRERQAAAPRRMRQLDRAEALRLLGTVSLGRIVFTERALPAVRPVSHLLDGEDIIVPIQDAGILTSLTAPAEVPGVVVAYQADAIDPVSHLGWSVVVTGFAEQIEEGPHLTDRYHGQPRCWGAHLTPGTLRIRPDLVSGFWLSAESEAYRARSA